MRSPVGFEAVSFVRPMGLAPLVFPAGLRKDAGAPLLADRFVALVLFAPRGLDRFAFFSFATDRSI